MWVVEVLPSVPVTPTRPQRSGRMLVERGRDIRERASSVGDVDPGHREIKIEGWLTDYRHRAIHDRLSRKGPSVAFFCPRQATNRLPEAIARLSVEMPVISQSRFPS